MTLRLLNTHVPDHVLVKGLVTKRSTAYSTNLFCDPNDPEETAYFEDELTPLEKGHFYLWKEDETGSVLVHMPYRIMDEETGDLLRGLSSYRSIGRLIAKSIPQRMTLSPKSCLQDFVLSHSEFQIFATRVKELGGLTKQDCIDLKELLESMELICTEAAETQNKLSTLRELYCLSSSEEKIDTADKLDEVLKEFAWVREVVLELSNKRVAVVKDLRKLNSEINRQTDYVRASTQVERVNAALNNFNATNFDRITREVMHKYAVDSGIETTSAVPAHIGTLSSALTELRNYYPALHKLSGHGDNVVIDLSGVRIILTPVGVQIDGDPSVLRAYMGEGATIDSSGNASLRRRRRNIVQDVEKK